ncbi:MAG TPA: 2-dehydropantoate 2-reductase [Methylomirabilota bacterium]|nr:2-dehydropantoate 2-reductase [Methylomirabilota bacterium]
MRIAVMGAGAVGGYFGAKLALAGHELAFIARGEHLKALRNHGLRVVSPSADMRVKTARFTDAASEIGAVDLILFCVKSYDTEAAAESLKPMIGNRTTILSLQNGVDNPEKIARFWGAERTLAGVVYVGAQLTAPGIITHSAGGKIVFGRLDGAADENARAVERALKEAQIPCELSSNIRQVQWTKLLWNAPFCAIGCLARADTKQIVESKLLTELARRCMAEVLEAARTQGIDLAPARLDETIAFSRGLGDFKPSMLQDLETGKPLEYEAFNGIVVKLLTQSGKAAPVNQTFYALLEHLNRQTLKEATR